VEKTHGVKRENVEIARSASPCYTERTNWRKTQLPGHPGLLLLQGNWLRPIYCQLSYRGCTRVFTYCKFYQSKRCTFVG